MANNRGGCNWCCNTEELARNPETFKAAVLAILCAILDASGGLVTGAVVLPQVAKLWSAVTNTYASLGLLDSTFKLNRLYVDNQTDANIEISLDGGVTTAFTAFANSSLTRELSNYTGTALTSVMIRYQAATVPTIGTAYFDGSY